MVDITHSEYFGIINCVYTTTFNAKDEIEDGGEFLGSGLRTGDGYIEHRLQYGTYKDSG